MRSSTLTELGVTESGLTEAERQSLSAHGYVNLGKLLSDEQLAAAQDRIATLLSDEGERAGAELFDSHNVRHPKEAGADRLANLVNKGSVFDVFYTHPRVLAAVAWVLDANFKLSSLNYRAAKLDGGGQGLHADWKEPVQDERFQVCNTIWMLDDFTVLNGATRVVPGSHRPGELPENVLKDVLADHADQRLVTGPAGSAVVFNAHVWHAGTRNQSKTPRRAIHSYFCRHDQQQQLDQARYLNPETAARLSPAVLDLLGVH